ncbi:MAG TPA: polyvinylalcohol dehydrogenase [Planctomycetaceae bacterium]|nr:polyvinylalcohol dehydrogenase [Planctomycetaceae bacterium]
MFRKNRPILLISTVCFASLVCWLSAAEPLEFRFWETKSGRRSDVKLQLVQQTDDLVTLKREDNGKIIQIPQANLSTADQRYLTSARQPLEAVADVQVTEVAFANAVSADWPRWRGVNNDGLSPETGLLSQWDGAPPVLWSTRGLGQGYSSVVFANGRIYTMGKKETVNLICLSAEDGSLVWETPVGGGSNPNCTPTVDIESQLVYGLSHAGDFVCADARTGREVWRKNFPRDFGGRMMSGWGYSESPLIDGDRIILTPGGDRAVMAALNKRTGEVIWTTPMQQASAGYASPVISQAGGIKQYITLVGKGLIGVAAENGRPLWHYDRIANTTANVPTPIVKGNYVFGSSGYGDGGSALLELSRQGRGIGVREVYYKRNNEYQNHHGGMVLIGDHIYMGEGHNKGFPICINMRSGRVAWGPERGAGSGSAALVAADGHLYFRYENGVMALVTASPRGYELKGSFRIKSNNGKSWAHPVIVDKKLYLRDQDELHCYDIASQ